MQEHLKSLLETFSKIPTRTEFVSAFKSAMSVITKALADVNKKVDARLAEIRDGVDGKDGQKGVKGDKGDRGDKGERGATFIALRGAQGLQGADGKDGSPDTAEQVRDKLESIEDEKEKLKIDAIGNLRKELDELKARPVGKGGGGTSAIGVAHAFKYIAHTEQPVGAIDGANLTYTVKNTIWWIAGFTINGEQVAELPNFTYSGHTITFASALPAAYSGKDWECKYIGT